MPSEKWIDNFASIRNSGFHQDLLFVSASNTLIAIEIPPSQKASPGLTPPQTWLPCQWPLPACQCRRRERWGFDPWVRKMPWKRKRQPTPVFLPRKSHGQRSLAGYMGSQRVGHDWSDLANIISTSWESGLKHGDAVAKPVRVSSVLDFAPSAPAETGTWIWWVKRESWGGTHGGGEGTTSKSLVIQEKIIFVRETGSG